MPYSVRFESQPFNNDQKIGSLLNSLTGLEKTVQNLFGANIKAFEGQNLQKLNGISVRTFRELMDWAEVDFQQQFTERVWGEGWPNRTFRRNGEIVPPGSTRDIVDLGGLMQSQRRTDMGVRNVEFEWTGGDSRDYAEYVHDGYTSKGGNRMPARPWTSGTIENIGEVGQSIIDKEAR